MGRLDWKSGRFSEKYETREIHGALRGHQRHFGDSVTWYRLLRDESVMHDIYDEGAQEGRRFAEWPNVPVLHVTNLEGPADDTEQGFYYNDSLHITAAFDQISRVGLTHMDVEHQTFLKDRIGYNGRLFRITGIAVLGQVRQQDLVVGIDATQLKPDELVNDLQFAKYAQMTGW